jgi:hypothetical protein
MGLLDTLKGAYENVKSAIQGPAQTVVDQTGLSNINPPNVAPESSGMTTTGGKRGKRKVTYRSKKSKKTIRRRK